MLAKAVFLWWARRAGTWDPLIKSLRRWRSGFHRVGLDNASARLLGYTGQPLRGTCYAKSRRTLTSCARRKTNSAHGDYRRLLTAASLLVGLT